MTTYLLRVYRDGTQISQSFCDSSTVTEIVTDDPPSSGTHTYTFKVGVHPLGGPGFTGNVGFARMTATVHKK